MAATVLKRATRVSLMCILAALSSACFEFTEEIWVDNEGGGRVLFTIGVSETLDSLAGAFGNDNSGADPGGVDCQKLTDEFTPGEGQDRGVSGLSSRVFHEAGFKYCEIDIRVSDFRKFAEAMRESDIQDTAPTGNGNFLDIEVVENTTVRIVHDFSDFGVGREGETEGSGQGARFANAVLGSMLAGRYITVIGHADTVRSNVGKLAGDGKTVTWRAPLAQLLSGTAEVQRFEMDLVAKKGLGQTLKGIWDKLIN